MSIEPSPPIAAATAVAEAMLLHELVRTAALRTPAAPALSSGSSTLTYRQLDAAVQSFASGLVALGLSRVERVGIYLEKRFESVISSFGAVAAGGVFVPMNPLLKSKQVAFIARDCDVRDLVTSPERLSLIAPALTQCPALRHVVVTDAPASPIPLPPGVDVTVWTELLEAPTRSGHRVIDSDIAAILYTSGSTGKPKGVVLSHRNMMAGAKSVASYLNDDAQDIQLAALPLCLDAGFSQLAMAFHAGARVVLLNYLMPRDVLKSMVRERVTGLTAVPPLYIQLCQLAWPDEIDRHLRYFASTGGRMPRDTLNLLRSKAPSAKPFLMYGLTEAFRSTYLPLEAVDRRPDSTGKALSNAEILVLREYGSERSIDEPGELVHRGALVGLSYWNDAEKTADRYRPLPAGVGGREPGLQWTEYAVYSGDTVRQDADGFLYFIGRRDEMIKTSGYRVSPTEVKELAYATQQVGEGVAFGIDHATPGQVIQVIATAPAGTTALDIPALLADCRTGMPSFMVPAGIEHASGPLPRNPSGKIDRKLLSTDGIERHAIGPLKDRQ